MRRQPAKTRNTYYCEFMNFQQAQNVFKNLVWSLCPRTFSAQDINMSHDITYLKEKGMNFALMICNTIRCVVSCHVGKRPHLLNMEASNGRVANWQSPKPTFTSAFTGMLVIS